MLFLVSVNPVSAQRKQNKAESDSLKLLEPVEIKVHSPHKATFYSAVLPGLGQAYNRKYWKLPILYGGIGALIYSLDFNSSYYKRYRLAYRDFLAQDPGNTSYLDDGTRPQGTNYEDFKARLEEPSYASWYESALENQRDYYRRNRDLTYVGMALVYVLNLIDASVDAHFKTFDMSTDISMNIEPTIINVNNGVQGVGMQIKLEF